MSPWAYPPSPGWHAGKRRRVSPQVEIVRLRRTTVEERGKAALGLASQHTPLRRQGVAGRRLRRRASGARRPGSSRWCRRCRWSFRSRADREPRRLVFRFDFPRLSRRIFLKANLSCREQSLEEGIIGNGACALGFSTDGLRWRPVINTLEPRIYGAIMEIEELLPDEACGSTSLWLRVRLLSTGPWKRADYSVAQFLRNRPTDTATCFELAVECEPEGEGSSATPLTD